MRRLTVWVSLLCVIAITGIGAIRAMSPTNDPLALRRAILNPGRCPMPCFIGIRPGVTSIHEALQILRSSPYLDPNSITALAPGESAGSFTINWRTPGAMLSGSQAERAGQDVLIENEPGSDAVKIIIVHINVPLGDFVPLFGPPPSTALRLLPNDGLFYVVEYPALGMQYDVWADCKQGQVIPALSGTSYVLQAPGEFQSQVSSTDNLGWHGFTARPFDQLAAQSNCTTPDPLNGWFARLFR
ncbi:MAG: hypothetical protein ACYDBJ_18840 [Aggregatilineales bacterium]